MTTARSLALTLVLMSSMLASLRAQERDGQISGVVVDVSGAPLAGLRLELRQRERSRAERLTSTTDASGAFRFHDLSPGEYQVELVIDGRVDSRSGRVELSPGAMRVSGVVVTRTPRWVRSDRTVASLPRTTATELLGGRGVTTSFEALREVLTPGRQIILTERGQSALSGFLSRQLLKGQKVVVAEISDTRLVLLRRRMFRTEELVLTPENVARIAVKDSTWNGFLIGASVGGALSLAEILQTRHDIRQSRDCNLCALGYFLGAAFPLLGAGIGAGIDGRINGVVYELPPPRRVTVTPLFGPDRAAVLARVRF